MLDIFTESVIRRKSMPGSSAFVGACKWLAIGSVCAALFMYGIMMLPAVIFGVAWYFARRNADVEFEYIHTNSDFDIDKVISNSSRKKVASVDLGHVDIVAPVGSLELERFKDLKRADYSAKDPENPPYGMVCMVKGNRKLLLLQLDEKMLASLKKYMPNKVIQ